MRPSTFFRNRAFPSRLSLLAAAALIIGCNAKDHPGAKPAAAPSLYLRLHGSNTIGAKLAPALARAYMRRLGADSIEEQDGASKEEHYLRARVKGEDMLVEVWSYGSNTGFNDLAWSKCDIAMSSKPIDAQNHQRLAPLGDMHAPESEHVLGLDGIAIIVNPANPTEELDVATVASLFLGRIRDWSRLPYGGNGKVTYYSRNKNSGTYDVFKGDVLEGHDVGDSAVICESNEKIAEAVAKDPQAVAYVPLGFVGKCKVLKLRRGDAEALPADKLTVVTEDYALSRRLFLYTAANPQNALVRDFISFAQSDAGQLEVEHSGFIAQIIRLTKPELPARLPARYASEVRGAVRVALNFRFRPGSSELDNRAQQDLLRLSAFLDKENLHPCHLKLFGFCDNVGGIGKNYALSAQRARVVADLLKKRGVVPATVLGMGSALPIASNETETGREKNRRIEVWLQCASELAAADAP